MGELEAKKEFVVPPPQYPSRAIQRQPVYKNMIRLQQENNISKLQGRKVRLQAAINASTSDSDQEELEDNMIYSNNEIVQAKYDQSIKISRFHSMMKRKGSGGQVRKLTLGMSRNTCSTSKKHLLSSLVSALNVFKTRCMTMTNGTLSTKTRSRWSFTH